MNSYKCFVLLNDSRFQPNLFPFLNKGKDGNDLDELEETYFPDGYWNLKGYPKVSREKSCTIVLVPLHYERDFICSQKPSWFKQFPVLHHSIDPDTKLFNHIPPSIMNGGDYIWKDSKSWYVSFNPLCYKIFVIKRPHPEIVNWLTWLMILIYNQERYRHYNLDGISILNSSKKQLYYYVKYAGRFSKKWKTPRCANRWCPYDGSKYKCPSCQIPLCGYCSEEQLICIYSDWCQVYNRCSICDKIHCDNCIKACYQHSSLLGLEGYDEAPSFCKPCIIKDKKLNMVSLCEYHDWILCNTCEINFKDGVEHFEGCMECGANSSYCGRHSIF